MKKILPAEWAPQDAIILTWPHVDTDWAPILEDAERVYFEIAEAILTEQDLVISCEAENKLEQINSRLMNIAKQHETQLFSYLIPADDTWARDHGPITVFDNNEPVLLDFRFNAWGSKYESVKDDKITQKLFEKGAFPGAKRKQIDFILEGGSIESDGKGTLLTTETCLLTDTRNNGLSKSDIEAALKSYLGIERILWLKHGYLAGDDTDAHIDTLARFCNETTIAYVACNNPEDEHYQELQAMEKELQQFRTLDDKPYNLIPLPMVENQFHQGERLPATYANFLIMNRSLLLPVYNAPQDQQAMIQIQKCFPDRKIIPIDCRTLIIEHGSLHCITMQLPRGTVHPMILGETL